METNSDTKIQGDNQQHDDDQLDGMQSLVLRRLPLRPQQQRRSCSPQSPASRQNAAIALEAALLEKQVVQILRRYGRAQAPAALFGSRYRRCARGIGRCGL